MPSKVTLPVSVADVLERHGFRAIEEPNAVGSGRHRYENQDFALELFVERDGELYMKVGPLNRSGESYFLPGVIAFLHSDDELTRQAYDIARGLDTNYEGLMRVLSSQPSGVQERERLCAWIAGFALREAERMRRAGEEAKKERARRRRWWAFW